MPRKPRRNSFTTRANRDLVRVAGIGPRFSGKGKRGCALPDIPYVGIVLTMPDVLWPIFRQNRHLLHDLPALGAAVIQQWAKLKCGVRLPIMVIPHTFGGRLNFNPHLHILVSGGGLQESEGRWVNDLVFDRRKM